MYTPHPQLRKEAANSSTTSNGRDQGEEEHPAPRMHSLHSQLCLTRSHARHIHCTIRRRNRDDLPIRGCSQATFRSCMTTVAMRKLRGASCLITYNLVCLPMPTPSDPFLNPAVYKTLSMRVANRYVHPATQLSMLWQVRSCTKQGLQSKGRMPELAVCARHRLESLCEPRTLKIWDWWMVTVALRSRSLSTYNLAIKPSRPDHQCCSQAEAKDSEKFKSSCRLLSQPPQGSYAGSGLGHDLEIQFFSIVGGSGGQEEPLNLQAP